MKHDLKDIFRQFRASGSWMNGSPAGSGHIHETWLIRTIEKNKPDYILQKINHQVFPPVAEMMKNILLVTNHIRNKRSGEDHDEVLEIIPSSHGESYYSDHDGNFWRLFLKVEPGITYDIAPGTSVAYEAGKAFGQFIDDLRDLNPGMLYPVIPGFHSIVKRYERLRQAIDENPLRRAKEVIKEIGFAEQTYDRLKVIPEMEKQGKIPVRITHNDTKLNNLLFDHQQKANCVIDLDLVMPGLSLYDFGDSIRTVCNTAHEDEPDLEKVKFNIPVFEAYANGFLHKTFSFLTQAEYELMPLSAQYITYIMGIRFLTDYLEGDVYYTIKDGMQNLRRCRTQFRLVELMAANYIECADIMNLAAEKLQHDDDQNNTEISSH